MKTSIQNGFNIAGLNFNQVLTFRKNGYYTPYKLNKHTEIFFNSCPSIIQMFSIVEHSIDCKEYIHAHILLETENQMKFIEEAKEHIKAKKEIKSMDNIILKTENKNSRIGFSDIRVQVETIKLHGRNTDLYCQKIQGIMNSALYISKSYDRNLHTSYLNSNSRIFPH